MDIFFNILALLFVVIVFLLILIAFLIVKICFNYNTDTGKMDLYLKVLFFKYKIFPKDPLRSKRKAIKKSKKKEKSKKATAEKAGHYITDEELKTLEQDAKGASKNEQPEEKKSFSDRINHFINLVRSLNTKISILAPAVRSSLKLEIKRLNVVVASKDAANAAVYYGLVCAAIEGLYAVGREVRGFKIADDVFVDVDYCKEKFSADIGLVLHIRASKLIIPALKVLFL